MDLSIEIACIDVSNQPLYLVQIFLRIDLLSTDSKCILVSLILNTYIHSQIQHLYLANKCHITIFTREFGQLVIS